ncbi:MAG: hypothetical protein M0Q87_00135 [Ottowia sp.]|nr:hypothetical protein [Ottowia sp.]
MRPRKFILGEGVGRFLEDYFHGINGLPAVLLVIPISSLSMLPRLPVPAGKSCRAGAGQCTRSGARITRAVLPTP